MGSFVIKSTGQIAANGASVPAEVRQIENSACGVQVVGTFSGSLAIEASMDGTTFDAYAFVNCGTGATATSITAPGQYRTELVGATLVRVRATAWTSGTATVTLVVKGN